MMEIKNPEDMNLNLQNINISDPTIIYKAANRRRRSPIMMEFTYASVTSVDLARVLEAGMNIAKFKMAFSTREERISMLSKMDKGAQRCAVRQGVPQCPVATCCAIKTWVKKSGLIQNGVMVQVLKDSEVILTCNKDIFDKCSSSLIFVDYPHIVQDTHVGMEITIGTGSVVLHCTEKLKDNRSIKCIVNKGGIFHSMETVYFRNIKHTIPYLCKVDINILKFCAQYQVDILMIYYAKDREMIKKVKQLISRAKTKPLIYSGICHQDGIDHFDEILQESDGVVFCREYIQYELASDQVYRMSMVQKWLAAKCLQVGKPMFITGVLESLIDNGDVSDAEISDVTNALMDGVTGFILKDCVDINNAVHAIYGLNEICCQVEPLTYDKSVFWRMLIEPKMPVNAAEAAFLSCIAVANQTSARVVILTTVSGRTARALLGLRPASIVIALCTRPQTARMLYTCRNIVPLVYKGPTNVKWQRVEEARVQYAAEFAVAKQWMYFGDMYVTLQKSFEGNLFCDVVRVFTVTFAKKMLVECHYSSEEEIEKDESIIIPEKKKRRKKKKKVEVEEVKALEEEEDEGDNKKSEIKIIKDSISKTAQESKSAVKIKQEKNEN